MTVIDKRPAEAPARRLASIADAAGKTLLHFGFGFGFIAFGIGLFFRTCTFAATFT